MRNKGSMKKPLLTCENGNVVEVLGGTKRQRELVSEIAHYCIRELMPRLRTLEIDITLNKCLDDGAFGFCYALDTNRAFQIEVDKRMTKEYPELGADMFIETVCHEMVHVWQQAKNMMIDRVRVKREFGRVKLGYRRFWKNLKTGEYDDHSETAYSKQPWERQAYRMQGKLVKGFKKEYYGIS